MKLPLNALITALFLFLLHLQVSRQSAVHGAIDCPLDCICYSDYLTNIASWKWMIENSANEQSTNDADNQDFNPYTEHNEVYDNTAGETKQTRSNEEMLKTVTCIIRNDSPGTLSTTLQQIPSHTQVLSILQAPGSGNITLSKEIMSKFHSLVGLELQGVSRHKGESGVNVFRLNANGLENNKKLIYLNLEKVLIEQHAVEIKNQVQKEDVYVKLSPISDNEENEMENDIQPRLLFLGIREKKESTNNIVPYSEYRKERIKNNNDLSGKMMKMTMIEPKIAVAFTQLSNLVHLRIADCNMEDVSWDMFYKLSSLKFLLLDRNDLLFLPDFTFYATPNLTALSLSGNRILNLQTVGLAGLLHLEKLDVTHNNITHLSELSLPPFPHLQVADFRYNPIEAIFPNTFEVMNTTKSLYIGNPNTPVEFFGNSFYGLVSLNKLEMTNVHVGALERPMLKGMPQLTNLIIMDGSIQRIMYDAFNEVPKLERLVLTKCSIKKISMDAFYGLNALQELDLSHNQLTIIPPGIFDEQVSLRELYLHHNQLTTLPTNLLEGIPVKMVRLEGNPWHCNCEMSKWNPSVINQVKRYYIPRNFTNCLVQYDKGSMCNMESSHQTFQVKYVYEKRISPVCATPIKFTKKSVFQVLHKILESCNGKKSSKKADKSSQKMNFNITTTGLSSLESKYQQERMMVKMAKVKKPEKKTKILTTTNGIETISTSTTTTSAPENSIPFVQQKSFQQANPVDNVHRSRLTNKLDQILSFKSKAREISQQQQMFNPVTSSPLISKKSLKLSKLRKSQKNRNF